MFCLLGEHELGEGSGEMLEGCRGGQVRLRRQDPLTDLEATLDHTLDHLRRVAEGVEAVVQGAVLSPVHRLLADEARNLALQRRVSDLVAEAANGSHEEVLAIREHR